MIRETLERRLETSKLLGQGFSSGEVVKFQTEKWDVSKVTIYNDLKSLGWLTQLLGLNDVKVNFAKSVNRHEYMYKSSMLGYLTATTENGKIGFLHMAHEAQNSLDDLLGLHGLVGKELLEPEPLGTPSYSEEEKQVLDKAASIIWKHRNEPRESIH